jgi:16S rRNA (guanine966-N2)-methyltransferase
MLESQIVASKPTRHAHGGRGLRVTGGRLGGRRLRAPARGVRPTADRVREAVFARLGDLEGAAVLDLYAGSGALGVEAASRGAASVVFVERAPATLAVLRANLDTLGLGDARVIAADAARAVADLGREGRRFDLVLLDPPWASDEAPRALAALVAAGVLRPHALVVVEHGRRHSLPVVRGLAVLDERRYGETLVTRLVPDAATREGDRSPP